MNHGHKMMLFLIFLLFGIMLTLQFRSILENTSEIASARDLAVRLEGERAKGQELRDTLSAMEAEMAMLEKNLSATRKNPEMVELIKARDFEYFRAGLTPVSGDGIIITMQDAPAAGEMEIEDYIIHDSDINAILSELRSQGAQAISINGERIIGTSRLICAGPTIFLNESRYPPPYVIKAIGDPDVLFDALDQMTNVAVMRFYGIQVDIAREYGMTIDRYRNYQSLEQMFSHLEVVEK